MIVSRDVERLARMMQAQKLEPDYIRHYLMESYQLDAASIDRLFEKIGIGRANGIAGMLGRDAPKAKSAPAKVNRSSFY